MCKDDKLRATRPGATGPANDMRTIASLSRRAALTRRAREQPFPTSTRHTARARAKVFATRAGPGLRAPDGSPAIASPRVVAGPPAASPPSLRGVSRVNGRGFVSSPVGPGATPSASASSIGSTPSRSLGIHETMPQTRRLLQPLARGVNRARAARGAPCSRRAPGRARARALRGDKRARRARAREAPCRCDVVHDEGGLCARRRRSTTIARTRSSRAGASPSRSCRCNSARATRAARVSRGGGGGGGARARARLAAPSTSDVFPTPEAPSTTTSTWRCVASGSGRRRGGALCVRTKQRRGVTPRHAARRPRACVCSSR